MSKHEALLLLSISLGAFIMPFISRRLMLPSAVGEILFGLAMRAVFGNVAHDTPVVRFLGELGFIVLMYLAGLEINFEKIRITPRRDLLLYVGMFLLVAGFSVLTVVTWRQPVIYVLVYLTTAVGLLFPVLKETGLMGRDTGQSLLIIGSIGEVVSLLAITGFLLYYKFGLTMDSLIHLGQIALFLVIAYLFLRLLRLLVWWYPILGRLFVSTGDSVESGIRANFANMFVFVALASLMDLELIVGAFLGGMLFAVIFKEREQIQEKLGGFGYGFLVPIFFIEVGLRFDIHDFLSVDTLLAALGFSLAVFLVRLLATPLLVFSRLSIREMLLVPFSTAFPLTLLVAIATLGLETGMLSTAQAPAILLTAIITSLLYPGMFKFIVRLRFITAES